MSKHNMKPEPDQNDLSEDLMMLTKHFEILKLMERDSCCAAGSKKSEQEPTPDGHVSTSGISSIHNNNNNKSATFGDDFFRGNLKSTIHQESNSSENEMNFGKNIMDNVKAFFKHPSLEVSVSSIISKDLLKYDVTERNAIYEEVHGVGNICPDESQPGMVENALQQLSEELDLLQPHKRSYYTKSLNFPHSYIHTTNFRLKMLRAELFHPKRAASRLENCLETMVTLFGLATLERPPQLSDFSKVELQCFNAGRIQLLPFRDRGGRRVIVGIPSQNHNIHNPVTRVRGITLCYVGVCLFVFWFLFSMRILSNTIYIRMKMKRNVRTKPKKMKLQAKIHFYLWWVASESVESQRNGLVLVTIHNPDISDAQPSKAIHTLAHSPTADGDDYGDNSKLPSITFARIYIRARRGMPIRLICLHTCTPDTPFYNILGAYHTHMIEERARFKFHVGK